MNNNRIYRRLVALISAFAILMLTSGCEDMLAELERISVSEPDTAVDAAVDTAETVDTADADLEGPYEVERVVDGDTLIVYIDGVRTRVRLIGINTPESVAPEEERNTEEGVIASDFVKELIDNTGYEVWLEYDNERLDQYDRTLAYVYIDYDGELVMLERILLEEGLAETVLFGTNDRYYDEFRELEAG